MFISWEEYERIYEARKTSQWFLISHRFPTVFFKTEKNIPSGLFAILVSKFVLILIPSVNIEMYVLGEWEKLFGSINDKQWVKKKKIFSFSVLTEMDVSKICTK